MVEDIVTLLFEVDSLEDLDVINTYVQTAIKRIKQREQLVKELNVS